MSAARFGDLLDRALGLDPKSIGLSAIERAVETRIKACNLKNDDDYWELLRHSRDEVQELIEAVIVPETWFFRDPPAYAAMVGFFLKRVMKGNPSRQQRLLSLPCSTGEEPYTMGMALLDAGVPASRFRVDAIDVSARSLMRARRGIYGRNSFRSKDVAFRERHFQSTEAGYRVNDTVREPVHFRQGNIVDPSLLLGAEPYDIIFCRNLLIYFDTRTQNRTLSLLRGLLAPDGMLFVGHAEAGLMAANGFASAKLPMAFAFLKALAQPVESKAEPATPRSPSSVKPARDRALPAKPSTPVVTSQIAQPAKPGPGLEELRRIADGGRLGEAAQGCEVHIREFGPSPDVFLLMGLIRDAAGDPTGAINYYRKVLYLEPTSSEALHHLALLLKKQGDHLGARLLEERLQRREKRRSR
ncbi:CheR family methyltransferase [Aquamicrobium soli]|uniref:CheR family methyltransferase n=1 Tax=Aquamicrobium soli TaxID=1811518 RepID=A0ABV7K760_9HYPH